MSRSNTGRGKDAARQTLRRNRVIELRAAGHTFAEIAELVGVSKDTVRVDLNTIRANLLDATNETAAIHRERSRMEVDKVRATAWEHVAEAGVEHAAKYLAVILKCEERIARLYGLDAPEQIVADVSVLSSATDDDVRGWLRKLPETDRASLLELPAAG